MKKTFIVINIILIALAINRASAQDFEPTQIKVRYGQDSIYMSTSDTIFKERKFMLGWHWNDRGRTLTEALGHPPLYEEINRECINLWDRKNNKTIVEKIKKNPH